MLGRLTALGVGALFMVLLALGFANRAAGFAYDQGKADATRAVEPYGVVIVGPDGACRVYDQPGQSITVEVGPGLAHLTTLVRLRR